MLTLSQLKQIVALSEHGSFTGAAQVLGLSHSALSQTLARLEDHYGVLFFQRLGRTLLLTPGGRVFLLAAQQSLAALTDAETSLRAINQVDRGRVVIGIDPVLRMLLPRDFSLAVKRENPDVALEFQDASWDVANFLLQKGRFNLWIGPQPENEDGLEEIFAVDTPAGGFFTVWDSRYAKGVFSLASLIGRVPLAVLPLPRSFGEFLLKGLPEDLHAGVISRSAFEFVSDNLEDLICFARQPEQLSLIPLCALPPRRLRKHGLVRVQVEDFPEASAGKLILSALKGVPLDPSTEAVAGPLKALLGTLEQDQEDASLSLAS